MMFDASQISPIAFRLFGLNVYWYGVAYVVGLWLALWYAKRICNQRDFGIDVQLIDSFFPVACLAIVIGGRLGHVFFFESSYYLLNLFEILDIRGGGMSFHGGLIGLILALYSFCQIKNGRIIPQHSAFGGSVKKFYVDFWRFADIIATVAPIGLGLGRVANFINNELYGKPTKSFLGVLFKNIAFPRHPTQIYEALGEGAVTFFILHLCWKTECCKRSSGVIFSFFLISYAVFRIVIDFFKESDLVLMLTVGQWFSLGMLFTGIVFFMYRKTKRQFGSCVPVKTGFTK
jgi:phosphatidylglycerol:prolipoprotein diacylglycerol transferase